MAKNADKFDAGNLSSIALPTREEIGKPVAEAKIKFEVPESAKIKEPEIVTRNIRERAGREEEDSDEDARPTLRSVEDIANESIKKLNAGLSTRTNDILLADNAVNFEAMQKSILNTNVLKSSIEANKQTLPGKIADLLGFGQSIGLDANGNPIIRRNINPGIILGLLTGNPLLGLATSAASSALGGMSVDPNAPQREKKPREEQEDEDEDVAVEKDAVTDVGRIVAGDEKDKTLADRLNDLFASISSPTGEGGDSKTSDIFSGQVPGKAAMPDFKLLPQMALNAGSGLAIISASDLADSLQPILKGNVGQTERAA